MSYCSQILRSKIYGQKRHTKIGYEELLYALMHSLVLSSNFRVNVTLILQNPIFTFVKGSDVLKQFPF